MYQTTHSRWHRRRGVPSDLIPLPGQRQRYLPFMLLGVVWRWRWELILSFAGFVAYTRLQTAGYSTVVIVVVLVETVAIVMLVPVTRRFVRNRVWCVTDRHRVRVCMNELRTLNYSGRGVFILAARATREGEALWLWLRPGLSVGNLEHHTDAIAAACWAHDARVRRSPKLAALVRVDILRRDPLARTHIESPLMATTRHLPNGEANTLRALHIIRGGLDTNTDTESANAAASSVGAVRTPAPKPETSTASKASTKSTPSAAAPSVSPMVSRTGEDVSDYV